MDARLARFLVMLALLTGPTTLRAQNDRGNFSRTSAYLPYTSPEQVKYTFTLGRLKARLDGAVNMEFNDNINLSQNAPAADLSFGPNVTLGFLYPITQEHVIQFDLGFGYRWYLNSPSVNTFNIVPSSHLDHTIQIGNVRLNFHDRFGVQVDPLSRAEISGGPRRLITFRRFNNDLGVSADWRAAKDWSLIFGYDYVIDRSLADDFGSLDHDTHVFMAGTEYILSPRWTLGVSASYSAYAYAQKIQNGGNNYTMGPSLTWTPTKFITVNASGGYSVSKFDNTGTTGDRSQFQGISYQIGVRHTLNSRMSHEVRAGSGVSLGLGSNFTEDYTVQYGISAKIGRITTLGASAALEHARSSVAGGEISDRYIYSLGLSRPVGRRWRAGLSYAFAYKNSDIAGNNYTQNRVTLDVTRQF